jgi:hypothetical protein
LQKCVHKITDTGSDFVGQHFECVDAVCFETLQRLNKLWNLDLNFDNSHLELHSPCPSASHIDLAAWTHFFLRYRRHYLTPEASAKFKPRNEQDCTAGEASVPASLTLPRDQGSLGLCFAYTAADLLSQKLGRPISALDAAFRYFQAKGATDLSMLQKSGGTTAEVIEMAEKNGFCLESALPSDAFTESLLKDRSYLASLSSDDLTYVQAGFGWEIAPTYAAGAEGLIKYIGEGWRSAVAQDSAQTSLIANNLLKVLPGFTDTELVTIFEKHRSRSDFAVVDDIFSRACSAGGRVSSNTHIHSVSYVPTTGESKTQLIPSTKGGFMLLPLIDANLKSGRMVAISYRVDRIIHDAETLKKLGFSTNTLHASSVVARHFDPETNQCEYKIRNSWGTRCDAYAEPYRSKCMLGYFWISEKDLSGMLVEASYIE